MNVWGRVTAIGDHPKGWTMKSIWEYSDDAGEIAFVVTPDVLMIDPDRASSLGSPQRSLEQVRFENLTRKQCTPDTTLGYLEGSNNKIHIDPDTARRFGFRAPIIAGSQTVNFLMEAVCRNGLADTF